MIAPDRDELRFDSHHDAGKKCSYCLSKSLSLSVEGCEDFYFYSRFGKFDFLRCMDCRSLLISRSLNEDELKSAYENYYTHDFEPHRDPEKNFRNLVIDRYIKYRFHAHHNLSDMIFGVIWEKFSKDFENIDWQWRMLPKAPARVLDYGCGNGSFLMRIRAIGYDGVGIEFDDGAIAAAKNQGIDVFTVGDSLRELAPEQFDAVTLNHVLEHVRDPLALLQQIRVWMKPGAQIYIECPNSNARGLEIFGKYWRGLEVPRHLTIPSVSGLTKVLMQAGFAVKRQIIPRTARAEVWPKSFDPVPLDQQEAFREKIAASSRETLEDAEFIGLVATKVD